MVRAAFYADNDGRPGEKLVEFDAELVEEWNKAHAMVTPGALVWYAFIDIGSVRPLVVQPFTMPEGVTITKVEVKR